MENKTKKDTENLSNEQLATMFAPVSRQEADFMERRQQVGLILIGLPALALVMWFLFT